MIIFGIGYFGLCETYHKFYSIQMFSRFFPHIIIKNSLHWRPDKKLGYAYGDDVFLYEALQLLIHFLFWNILINVPIDLQERLRNVVPLNVCLWKKQNRNSYN